jgi:hypothetical protein
MGVAVFVHKFLRDTLPEMHTVRILALGWRHQLPLPLRAATDICSFAALRRLESRSSCVYSIFHIALRGIPRPRPRYAPCFPLTAP